MIPNHVIQADLLAALKADTALLAELPQEAADHIKESQYTGEDFDFPAIRLKVLRQIPIDNRGHCDHARLSFSIYILTEGKSSRQANLIAGLVNDLFHGNEGDGKFFRGDSDASNEWTTFLRSSGLMTPFRTGQNLWQAEASFGGVVYPA